MPSESELPIWHVQRWPANAKHPHTPKHSGIVACLSTPTLPVKREDEDREEHLVANARAQKLPVDVVLPGAILQRSVGGGSIF